MCLGWAEGIYSFTSIPGTVDTREKMYRFNYVLGTQLRYNQHASNNNYTF